METITIDARVRQGTKKGPARRLRVLGFTPAVVYGAQREPVRLEISSSDLKRVLEKVRKETVFIKLAIDDAGKKTESLSILKDIQVNALKKEITHADFYEINMSKPLTIDVPVLLTGTAPGIEKGGELIMMKRELKVSGLPSDLPETVEVDVSALDIQESVRVGDIILKDGITLVDSDDVVIAHVAITRAAMAAAGAAAGEAAEGEPTEAAEAKEEVSGADDTAGEE
jgi:large subunit ribosomal protein L25